MGQTTPFAPAMSSLCLLCVEKLQLLDITQVPKYKFSHRSEKMQKEKKTIKQDKTIIVSVQFSCTVLSDPLRPHGLQHTWLPCPSPTPRACSNSCPSSWQSHATISSSVIPFSSCFQRFPASECFPMSQFFAYGGQRIGASASASVLPMNIQD